MSFFDKVAKAGAGVVKGVSERTEALKRLQGYSDADLKKYLGFMGKGTGAEKFAARHILEKRGKA